MRHITVDKRCGECRTVKIECVKDDKLKNIDIKDQCFLLIVLTSGKLVFEVDSRRFSAVSPAFICFDETEVPVLVSKSKAKYTCIYFHPEFLNVNMTFDALRQKNYDDIATVHDLFLLKPFIDKAYVVPIECIQVEKLEQMIGSMQNEIEDQRDWYWSCRGRSYFMEIIIVLERMYGLTECRRSFGEPGNRFSVAHPKLQNAVLYIEGHFDESLKLSDIVRQTGINHTLLTSLMKKEFGCTAMEYLMRYRVYVAKKQLEFTDVPIKDIAFMTGFKTVQHFGRVFFKQTGATPAVYRKRCTEKRKEDFKGV